MKILIPGDCGVFGGQLAPSLADDDRRFKGRRIFTGLVKASSYAPLYRKLLGSALDTLPGPVKVLHAGQRTERWHGAASVRRGRGALAGLIAALIGFPREGDGVPVAVTIEPNQDGELWTRDFGGQVFRSHQSCGTGKDSLLLVERFGVVRVAVALVADSERLLLVPRRWSVLRIPMPRALLPTGTCFETEVDGRFHFHVEITFPVMGPIVSYTGWLKVQDHVPVS
jgi:hypothetical protein